MPNEIIQDYSKTVSPELYSKALQGHQYIPQADQVIRTIITRHYEERGENWQKILDLGCGPGRLTFDFALDNNCHVMGVDISPEFIKYAQEVWWEKSSRRGTVSFQVSDFAQDGVNDVDDDKTFDVILMQGVMHHIHGDNRAKFLQRSFELLGPDGILVIGDEFIKDYETEEGRVLNVAKLYLHIIDEARKGGFNELAEEEAKNLIDDCFSGTKYAGFAAEKTFTTIYQYAQVINKQFYDYGAIAGLNFEAHNQIRNMLTGIKTSIAHLVDVSTENFNRGDFKTSISRFVSEVQPYGFVLRDTFKIGPVDELGGMGVLVFCKK